MKNGNNSELRYLSAILVVFMLCALLTACGGGNAPSEKADTEEDRASSAERDSRNEEEENQPEEALVSDAEEAPIAATETEAETGEINYAKYNGYTYYLDDGTAKYYLDFTDGFKLHCFFRSGDPEYYEEIYTLDPSYAVTEGNLALFPAIKDGKGNDISDHFELLIFEFQDDAVVMYVTRNERTLAGGEDDNVLTGAYTFTAPDGAAAGGQKTGTKTYTTDELGAMAQRYYDRKANYYPPEVEVIDNGNGTFTIHLYEIVNNGDGTYHTATSAWYTVDASGIGTDDIYGDAIDLAE